MRGCKRGGDKSGEKGDQQKIKRTSLSWSLVPSNGGVIKCNQQNTPVLNLSSCGRLKHTRRLSRNIYLVGPLRSNMAIWQPADSRIKVTKNKPIKTQFTKIHYLPLKTLINARVVHYAARNLHALLGIIVKNSHL